VPDCLRLKTILYDSYMPTLEPSEPAPVTWLLRHDPHLRRISRHLLREQAKLRGVVDSAAWKVYLRLEELHNARLVALTDRLVAWAQKSRGDRRR
jgi:hypothetical protein